VPIAYPSHQSKIGSCFHGPGTVIDALDQTGNNNANRFNLYSPNSKIF
jgi:hypothetical protein